MEKKTIPSFTIDHTRLRRGVYVSRKDYVANEVLMTYDIRVKTPYSNSPEETPMTPEMSHTIEHLGATWLRNNPEIADKVIYFGPMGCLTGFYLIMKGTEDMVAKELVREMVVSIVANYDNGDKEIPGCSMIECGNYKLNDLDGAISLLREFAACYDEWDEEYR